MRAEKPVVVLAGKPLLSLRARYAVARHNARYPQLAVGDDGDHGVALGVKPALIKQRRVNNSGCIAFLALLLKPIAAIRENVPVRYRVERSGEVGVGESELGEPPPVKRSAGQKYAFAETLGKLGKAGRAWRSDKPRHNIGVERRHGSGFEQLR